MEPLELSELDKTQKAIFVQRWLREALDKRKTNENKTWTELLSELVKD